MNLGMNLGLGSIMPYKRLRDLVEEYGICGVLVELDSIMREELTVRSREEPLQPTTVWLALLRASIMAYTSRYSDCEHRDLRP